MQRLGSPNGGQRDKAAAGGGGVGTATTRSMTIQISGMMTRSHPSYFVPRRSDIIIAALAAEFLSAENPPENIRIFECKFPKKIRLRKGWNSRQLVNIGKHSSYIFDDADDNYFST